ncbi:hypothetical protein RFI_06622 [Reticulomyxa filosa]|uniref:Uncharacterized protein n=1 Tax=Reticulomyxa filosa TaxID=46433 RepID=X6NXF1_RETFI|nr:hypothetical protein RFI_06622 [Reticulomyxa filosa]|eukprot:ETO30499.1 hypothetical protein RFI_06622 [Reticulomyxa filosa]
MAKKEGTENKVKKHQGQVTKKKSFFCDKITKKKDLFNFLQNKFCCYKSIFSTFLLFQKGQIPKNATKRSFFYPLKSKIKKNNKNKQNFTYAFLIHKNYSKFKISLICIHPQTLIVPS